MSRKLRGVERLESRCVLSAGIGPVTSAEPISSIEMTVGQMGLSDIQPLIVAGNPNGIPPDSPVLRVDANLASSPYAGVGSLEIQSGGSSYICTASVIAPQYVLTAAHCLDLNNNGTIDVNPPNVIFHLNFGGNLTQAIPAAELHVHPNFTGFARPTVNDDVAVVKLSESVPAGVPIYALNANPPIAGQQITMVGYGQSGDGVSGYYVSPAFDVKRTGSNRTDDFEIDDEGSGNQEVFLADFDAPTGGTNFLGGTSLGNAIETTLGGGDSGGPSFVNPTGAPGDLSLYGIDTFSTRFRQFFFFLGPAAPLFGSGFGGIVVAPYVDWIKSFIGTNGDIPPTVDITSPANLATVSGPILVAANAFDDHQVAQVAFFVDGIGIGIDSDGSNGWSVTWDSMTVVEGSHTIGAVATDSIGQTGSDSVAVNVDNQHQPDRLYFSLGSNATIGGLNVVRDDIVAWDGTTFSRLFDGSDVGLTDQFGTLTIDAFSLMSPTEILLSFAETGGILGFGSFDDSDIIKFTATSLGENTAGSWSIFFDGSDVGLTQGSEDIDELELLPNGRLLISMTGAVSVPGASGQAEDLFQFVPSSLGNNTAGTWSIYFDGSDVGLSGSSENVDGLAVGANGEIYLSTLGSFSVPGVSGANEDVFVFRPTQTGPTTQGSYDAAVFFDGSSAGLGALDVKAIELPATSPTSSASSRGVQGDLVEHVRSVVTLTGLDMRLLERMLTPAPSIADGDTHSPKSKSATNDDLTWARPALPESSGAVPHWDIDESILQRVIRNEAHTDSLFSELGESRELTRLDPARALDLSFLGDGT